MLNFLEKHPFKIIIVLQIAIALLVHFSANTEITENLEPNLDSESMSAVDKVAK